MLIQAALNTLEVEMDPEPFVLQTQLGDYSVSYQINAYTPSPSKMALIYSDLYKNIQDAFSDSKIETLSPMYNAVRDGNTPTTPAEYKPKESEKTQNPTPEKQKAPLEDQDSLGSTRDSTEIPEDTDGATLLSKEEALRISQEEAEKKREDQEEDEDKKDS